MTGTFTMVNMASGRRDRYVGIDQDDRLLRQARQWLPKANWFPIGDLETSIKVEHQGPTWANFHVCYLRDRVATRCFVALEAGASARTWGMARDEQAWFADRPKRLATPAAPWLAVVLPDNLDGIIPLGVFASLVPIERAMMWAVMMDARNWP